jgi:hypothetical protein
MYQKKQIDGWTITIWSAVCLDCKFETGLADVKAPDGRRWMLTGAGCFDRRGVKEVKIWASNILQSNS